MAKMSKREMVEAAREAERKALVFPAPTAEMLAAIEKAKAKSAAAHTAKEESFARCDTDGFLTQWAHGLTAQEESKKVEILAQGGYDAFIGLFDKATGKRVPAKVIETSFQVSPGYFQSSTRWMVCDPVTGKATGTFYPTGWHSTKLAKAGLEQRWEIAPARVFLKGKGTGLSGTAWVAVDRTDGGWPGAPEWKGGK